MLSIAPQQKGCVSLRPLFLSPVSALCSCHLSCCCSKIPGDSGKQLVESVGLPHALQVQSIMMEKTGQQGCEAAAYVITHSEEAER